MRTTLICIHFVRSVPPARTDNLAASRRRLNHDDSKALSVFFLEKMEVRTLAGQIYRPFLHTNESLSKLIKPTLMDFTIKCYIMAKC